METRLAFPVETLAERMFNAYNSEGPNPWRTWDGKQVPKWSEPGDQVRGKWMAAARKALEPLEPAETR